MTSGAWILGFFLLQGQEPPKQEPPKQEPPKQEPEAKAKDRTQPAGDQDRSHDATEITRAAARLIEAKNYRFQVTAERPLEGGEMQKIVIDGRFREGAPLMLKNERAELIAYRTDDRVAFRQEKRDDWDVVRLDAALFGGDGSKRIRRHGPVEHRPEGQGEPQKPKGEERDQPKPQHPQGEQREPGEARGSERLFDDKDPAANREDRQALIWIALAPAPHDLVRALLDGITETTRRVEKGGFLDKDKIVYESRLTPRGEQLCRDHFARLLGGRDGDRGELACLVRVVGDQEGDVDHVQLEVRRPDASPPLALRLDYEIDKIGSTEFEVPEDARRVLKE